MYKCFGDSKIIARQVRNCTHYNSPRLKNYQLEVWNLISKLEAFNIKFFLRAKNTVIDSLTIVASRFAPLEDSET